MSKFQYLTIYRRKGESTSHQHRRVVVAENADDARRVVAAIDPAFLATVKSPKRGAEVKA